MMEQVPLREAMQRKARSEAILRKARLRILPTLPVWRAGRLRSAKVVARRCLVLTAIQAVGFGRAPMKAIPWLREQGLWASVSTLEKRLLEAPRRTPAQLDNMGWRIEVIWTLWWALGIIRDLGWPPRGANLNRIWDDRGRGVPFLEQSTAAFVAAARLRPLGQILDAADLTYRTHWYTRNAMLQRRRVQRVDPGTVAERHHAFNWLLHNHARGWDDVDTPT